MPVIAVMTRVRLSAAEAVWYILGCVCFGGMYIAKVPVKKALAEAGLARMTNAEHIWYMVLCVALGAGYLGKLPAKKALSEVMYLPEHGHEEPAYGEGPGTAQRGPSRARHGRMAVQDYPLALRPLPPSPRHAQHDSDAGAWLVPAGVSRPPRLRRRHSCPRCTAVSASRRPLSPGRRA
jgi:hypothetical protein